MYPSAVAGSTLNRTLILYNDEFADTVVTTDATQRAIGLGVFDLALSEHTDIPVSFQVPYTGG